jgi:hypothetical protein
MGETNSPSVAHVGYNIPPPKKNQSKYKQIKQHKNCQCQHKEEEK